MRELRQSGVQLQDGISGLKPFPSLPCPALPCTALPCPALKRSFTFWTAEAQLCPCFSSAHCCAADWPITSGKCSSPSCFTPAGKYIGTGTPQGIVDCLKLQSTVREGEPTFPQAGSATKTSAKKKKKKSVFQGKKTFKMSTGKLTY